MYSSITFFLFLAATDGYGRPTDGRLRTVRSRVPAGGRRHVRCGRRRTASPSSRGVRRGPNTGREPGHHQAAMPGDLRVKGAAEPGYGPAGHAAGRSRPAQVRRGIVRSAQYDPRRRRLRRQV